jgi:hypothetical protein
VPEEPSLKSEEVVRAFLNSQKINLLYEDGEPLLYVAVCPELYESDQLLFLLEKVTGKLSPLFPIQEQEAFYEQNDIFFGGALFHEGKFYLWSPKIPCSRWIRRPAAIGASIVSFMRSRSWVIGSFSRYPRSSRSTRSI